MKPDLEALRAEPHAKPADLFTFHEPLAPADLEQIAEYLADFFAPTEGFKCRGCGRSLGGFFGSLEWGIVHGEARCRECGLPARVYHEIRDAAGEKLLGFSIPLQYHADGLSWDSRQ